MFAADGPRKKLWHESKHLRKRVAFLLEDPDLIPTDICFRIAERNDNVEEVQGHRIFFALASPVFHAMFYGSMKEEGDVEIVDVTVDAFLCLKKYMYTDSFDGVSVANMIDVLAASKKYLMGKLTRYCYEFIQNHITAENSAQHVFDDTVVDQCCDEIKRNTARAVLSEDFLNVTQDQLLELTGCNDLTISDFDLFLASKRWKNFQEDAREGVVSCSRKEDGIFQNIRFALLTTEQLADRFILDEVFSVEDLKEMFCYKSVGKELTTFNPRPREPVALSYQLTIKYYVSDKPISPLTVMNWQLFGSMDLLIWADVAPNACQLLLQYVEQDYLFNVIRTVETSKRLKTSVVSRKVKDTEAYKLSKRVKISSVKFNELEKQSGLWFAPDSVVLVLSQYHNPFLVTTSRYKPLRGSQPEIPPGRTGQCGIVVGKVLNPPPVHVQQLQDFLYAVESGLRVQNPNWAGMNFKTLDLKFECSVVEPGL